MINEFHPYRLKKKKKVCRLIRIDHAKISGEQCNGTFLKRLQ